MFLPSRTLFGKSETTEDEPLLRETGVPHCAEQRSADAVYFTSVISPREHVTKMATLTLKPGPSLFYLPEYDGSILTDLDRYGELPQETCVTQLAHEYLFERLRQIDDPCLSDFVLLADGNPYLLSIYARENAIHLVTDALQLRARPVAPAQLAQHLLLSDESGYLRLYVVFPPDATGWAEFRDAGDLLFADVHALPILFEPFAKGAGGGAAASSAANDTLEPTLGEILRLVFINFAIDPTNRDEQELDVGAEWTDSYDSDRRLAAYDSEADEIEAEMQSYQDDRARSEDSGWYER